MASAQGTRMPAMRSAWRAIGALAPWASATVARIRPRTVSPPVRSTRTVSAPAPLTVPPNTSSPGALATGTGSPVTVDSSTKLLPAVTEASTGTRSPGLIRTASPTATSSTGNLPFLAVTEDARGRRAEVHEARDRVRGAAARDRFQQTAEQDQGHDHARRLEIGDRRPFRKDRRREERENRISESRPRPDHDQAIHPRAGMAELGPAMDEEPAPGPQHDRGREQRAEPTATPARPRSKRDRRRAASIPSRSGTGGS